MEFSDNDLRALDAEFAAAGIAMHARPLRAAMRILGPSFSLGPSANPDVKEITAAYDRLFPGSNRTWPGMGIGLAAVNDRVKRVVVAVAYGSPRFEIHDMLGFASHAEYEQWAGGHLRTAARAAYAGADLFDLTYGVDDNREGNAAAYALWRLALSNLEEATHALESSFSTASIVQPISLTAELALKAALVALGVSEKDLASKNKFGHNLTALSSKLAELKPHRDDALVARAVAAIPDYVQSRYKDAGLNRLQLVELALGAQFIAASAARRISDRDFAQMMEVGAWPGPRETLYDF